MIDLKTEIGDVSLSLLVVVRYISSLLSEVMMEGKKKLTVLEVLNCHFVTAKAEQTKEWKWIGTMKIPESQPTELLFVN